MCFSVFEEQIVEAFNCKTTNTAITADYISIKNCDKVFIVANLTQAVGHATVLTPKRATAVAGTGVTTLGSNVRIWANEDTAASDTLVAQTAATSYTVAADVKNKIVVFEIDTHSLGDYDVVGLGVSASSQATNFASANFILTDLRYAQTTPPTAITD